MTARTGWRRLMDPHDDATAFLDRDALAPVSTGSSRCTGTAWCWPIARVARARSWPCASTARQHDQDLAAPRSRRTEILPGDGVVSGGSGEPAPDDADLRAAEYVLGTLDRGERAAVDREASPSIPARASRVAGLGASAGARCSMPFPPSVAAAARARGVAAGAARCRRERMPRPDRPPCVAQVRRWRTAAARGRVAGGRPRAVRGGRTAPEPGGRPLSRGGAGRRYAPGADRARRHAHRHRAGRPRRRRDARGPEPGTLVCRRRRGRSRSVSWSAARAG